MEAKFWHQVWKDKQIGFHESKANPLLVDYFDSLELAVGSRVFLPLCGKTLDIHWLMARGYQVVGAELSEMAVRELFEELGIEPKISDEAEFRHYSAEKIDILVGDVFKLNAELLGTVGAIYDRAALVALPPEMRIRYADLIRSITSNAKQLLICIEYDQQLMEGPPFSISAGEVLEHYSADYQIRQLDSREIKGGFKGEISAIDSAWLLLK